MPPRRHSWEQDAADVATWLDTEAKTQAAALMEQGRAPFAAPLTQAEKVTHYDQMAYNPDGTPNLVGRQTLIDRMGVERYTRVMQAVNQHRSGVPFADDLPQPSDVGLTPGTQAPGG